MRRRPDPDILIACMPWASTTFPSLGAGLLVSAAREHGFSASAWYPNLDFSLTVGTDTYEWLSSTSALFSLCEHLFAVDLFGADALDSDAFLAKFGRDHPDVVRAGIDLSVHTLAAMRDYIVPAFLDDCAAELERKAPDIVGFTCLFNQALPSLALARRIKAARPETIVLLGGGLMHGTMGPAYARAFRDTVDHVFNGESDFVFPEYLEALRDGRDLHELAGLTIDGQLTAPVAPVVALDETPIPNFDDFFSHRDRLVAAGEPLARAERLPFESARGCWWGQKHHCVFCGLNNEGMAFRAKSPDRVVAELVALSTRYGETTFVAGDNILARNGYTTLLPRIAELGLNLRLLYEIKANITRDEVAALSRGGVAWVIPGIESFSNHVLEIIRKGTTATLNIQLLKWLQEFGIMPIWNLLIGFPGETDADYEEMIALLPKLHHLHPPTFGQGLANIVQVHRFAPYFNEWAELGLQNVRAGDFHRHLIPPHILRGEEYGYFFDRDIPPDDPVHRHMNRLNAAMKRWSEARAKCVAHLGPGFLRFEYVSPKGIVTASLSRHESLVYALIDAQSSALKVKRAVERLLPHEPVDVDAALASLIARNIAVEVDGRVVGTVPFARPLTGSELQGWIDRWIVAAAAVDQAPNATVETMEVAAAG